jgi:prepilin-type N-terminal cleavage/methylation domain-containing protein
MIRRFRPFSRGMTLIEVLAGLVVLGTVLASVAVARSRYMHQAALADQRAAAVTAADRLLNDWWRQSEPLPQNASGQIDEQLTWRTHVLVNPAARQLGADIVRLEMLRGSSEPLVTVDVLVPPVKEEKP